MHRSYTTEDGITYSYTADESGNATITSISPCAGEVSIPEIMEDGIRVTVIGRKCCLGAGRLREVCLPESIQRVEDWAFAGCRRLIEVHMPRAELGMGVFQDCGALRSIELSKETKPDAANGSATATANGPADTGSDGDTAALLAALSQRKDAAYLMELKEAGSSEWYRRLDLWLEKWLEASDQEGYSGQVPCGEEDYGSSDVGAYESGRRREKCELALLRLIHPRDISDGFRSQLCEYAISHTAGSAEGDECWQVILHRHPEEREWYEALGRLGGINEKNRDIILTSIPEEYVEMRSYFINTAGDTGGGNFLDGLAL